MALQDARRGDIIGWEIPDSQPGQNSGHVFFVVETPTVDDSGIFSVRVYDSADRPRSGDFAVRRLRSGRWNGLTFAPQTFEVELYGIAQLLL